MYMVIYVYAKIYNRVGRLQKRTGGWGEGRQAQKQGQAARRQDGHPFLFSPTMPLPCPALHSPCLDAYKKGRGQAQNKKGLLV